MAFKMKGWQAHSSSPFKDPKGKFFTNLKDKLVGGVKTLNALRRDLWEDIKDKSINMSNATGMGSDWVDSQRANDARINAQRQKYIDALRAQREEK